MKNKFLLALLSLSLTLFLFACGENANTASNTADNSETVTSTVSTDKKEDETPEATSVENNTEDTSDVSSDTETANKGAEEPTAGQVTLSNNLEDYTIEDIEVFIGNVIKETEYYYGPSEAFEIYKDVSGGMDMGHPMPGYQAIVYGQCIETGWWRLDLGRSGDYPVVFVPGDCIEMP